jgi:hypothetical protein
MYGIKFIVKLLRYYGYSDYREKNNNKKFAVLTGDITTREKNKIKNLFNSKLNDDGKLIKILIGSPSIKEGI